MSRKKRFDEDDDGRVIAPMDIDGMPWHDSRAPERGEAPEEPAEGRREEPVRLTKEESRAYAAGAVKAALLVALVFAGAFLLFILFCTPDWFA